MSTSPLVGLIATLAPYVPSRYTGPEAGIRMERMFPGGTGTIVDISEKGNVTLLLASGSCVGGQLIGATFADPAEATRRLDEWGSRKEAVDYEAIGRGLYKAFMKDQGGSMPHNQTMMLAGLAEAGGRGAMTAALEWAKDRSTRIEDIVLNLGKAIGEGIVKAPYASFGPMRAIQLLGEAIGKARGGGS